MTPNTCRNCSKTRQPELQEAHRLMKTRGKIEYRLCTRLCTFDAVQMVIMATGPNIRRRISQLP